ncbi:putative glycosyltransferase [Synechococcus sp. BIOS-U3-1]|nr:putative glycosyltransferase [Synechococcus sp. BIOS-U3-1]
MKALGIVIAIHDDLVGLACTIYSIKTALTSTTQPVKICIVITPETSSRKVNYIAEYYGIDKLTLVVSRAKSGVYHAYNHGSTLLYKNCSHIIFLGGFDCLYVLPKLPINKTLICRSYLPKRRRIHHLHKSFSRTIFNNCHQSIFYEASFIIANSYDPKYAILADFLLNLKLYKSTSYSFSMLVTSRHDDYAGISKSNYDLNFWNDYSKNLSLLGYNPIQAYASKLIHNLLRLAIKVYRAIKSES